MKFVIKVISLILLIGTLYLLGVFIMPDTTDKVAGFFGFQKLNQKIRNLKSGSEKIGEVIDTANQVKSTIDTKVDQANDVIDKTQKTIDKVEEAKKSVDDLSNSINDLTTLTGSSSTGSAKKSQ